MTQQWLFDFDMTAFDTFAPTPDGLDMERRYELAVEEVLGGPALAKYRAAGGLRNRAPLQVIQQLRPEAEADTLRSLADSLVKVKLAYSLGQIGEQADGSIWPKPCQGFLEFWSQLCERADAGLLQCGIVSSGHQAFIEKTWQAHGLRLPDVIVSDDDLRGRRQPAELARRVKPGVLPLALARYRLANRNENVGMQTWRAKSGVIYFGDDLVKDGGMAQRAGVWFGHFSREATNGSTAWGAQFSDWKWAERLLP